jgi:hypothetical protein
VVFRFSPLSPSERSHISQATETFPNEEEAESFARAKLAVGSNITAGTLNAHLPKRTIAFDQVPAWLDEPDG